MMIVTLGLWFMPGLGIFSTLWHERERLEFQARRVCAVEACTGPVAGFVLTVTPSAMRHRDDTRYNVGFCPIHYPVIKAYLSPGDSSAGDSASRNGSWPPGSLQNPWPFEFRSPLQDASAVPFMAGFAILGFVIAAAFCAAVVSFGGTDVIRGSQWLVFPALSLGLNLLVTWLMTMD